MMICSADRAIHGVCMAGGGRLERRLILLLSADWNRITKVRRGAASAKRTRIGRWTGSNPQTRGLMTCQPAARHTHRYRWVDRASFAMSRQSDQAVFGSTMRAIAQMKPTSSLAIAVITFGAALPAAIRWR